MSERRPHREPIRFGARSLFGWYHAPDGAPRRCGVVLCNPLGTDFTRGERVLRHLAERLSAAGFPTLRFDFFGTGDSPGDEHEPSLVRAWLDDVAAATDALRARSGATETALVGLRLGATLAAVAAAERGGVDSLVLWTPCVSGAAFVAEVTKLHKLYQRLDPDMAEDPAQDSPPGGREALGMLIPDALAEELASVDLFGASEAPARATLVVDDGGLKANRDRLVEHLARIGASPTLETRPGQKFLFTTSIRATVPFEVLDAIVDWLSARHAARDGVVAGVPVDVVGLERAVELRTTPPLFGIYLPPAEGTRRPGQPAIVLSNAGTVNRVGPHRLYVRMARRWASLGFPVLRVDLSGIGDSPASGADENLAYPPHAVADLQAAMSWLSTTGIADRFVVAGLCSGADLAFQTGLRDDRVVGAVIMNPRTFCMLDLHAVETNGGKDAPAASIENVALALDRMVARGIETLLVVTERDPGVSYVDLHFGDDMRALRDRAGFSRVDLVRSDHTFTPVRTQHEVIDLVTAHLVAKHGGRA